MYRISVRLSGHVLLLLGALLSGVAAATSINGAPGTALTLPPSAPALPLQRELYQFGVLHAGVSWPSDAGDIPVFAALPELDAAIAVVPVSPRSHDDQSGSRMVAPTAQPDGSTDVAAPPMPTALWILGTGMIGLSAVGRRRAPPLAMAV